MMPTITTTTIKVEQQKVVSKLTKVRRTRQPKNPQLSVARRNERERNRVKMVNNGFALLREHLPIEDLQDCEQSGSDTPTPEGGSVAGGSKGQKTKKYSKVETLRAAIQRIKMLEELIRSTEPGFESINVISSSSSANNMAFDDEALSCGSSPSTVNTATTTTMHGHINQHHLYTTNQQGQFIKLEPQMQQQVANMPSPQNSQTSHSSGLNYSATPTQVHHHLQINQQQQQQVLEVPSHTHLWIQQHQNSFMEQQQQQMNADWYPQQHSMEAQQFIQSPADQTQISSSQQQQSQISTSLEQSPVWFNNSPLGNNQTSSVSPTQALPFGAHHHHHQISLYSQ